MNDIERFRLSLQFLVPINPIGSGSSVTILE